MFWRDVPAWGTYFWAYEVLKRNFVSDEQSSPLSRALKMMVCGGVAGQVSWIVSYPFDVIKCVIMVSEGPVQTMKQVIRENYRARGFRWFWAGLSSTMVQSFVANAVCLPTYDYLNELLLPPEWQEEFPLEPEWRE